MVEWSFDTRDANAARNARLAFVEYLHRRYGDRVDLAAAELVLGELIGNVVRHAPGYAHVQADVDDTGVTIAVKDSGHGFAPQPIDLQSNPFSESGRGLAIVVTLAETLEIECRRHDGCCVRARIHVGRDARH